MYLSLLGYTPNNSLSQHLNSSFLASSLATPPFASPEFFFWLRHCIRLTMTTTSCSNSRWSHRDFSPLISRDFDSGARMALVSAPHLLYTSPWRHRRPRQPAALWSSLWSAWSPGQRSRLAPWPRSLRPCTPRPLWSSPLKFLLRTPPSRPKHSCDIHTNNKCHLYVQQVRKVLWTRKRVRATAVKAGHCTHAELTSGRGHALASCCSCCVHTALPGLC